MKTKTPIVPDEDAVRERFFELDIDSRRAIHDVWVKVQTLAQTHAPADSVKSYIDSHITEARFGVDAAPIANLMFVDYGRTVEDLAA